MPVSLLSQDSLFLSRHLFIPRLSPSLKILFFSLFNYLYLPFSLSHFKKTCMTFVSLVRARSLESRERTVGTNGATYTLLPFFWTLLFSSFLVGSECPFMWEGTPFITDLSKKALACKFSTWFFSSSKKRRRLVSLLFFLLLNNY